MTYFLYTVSRMLAKARKMVAQLVFFPPGVFCFNLDPYQTVATVAILVPYDATFGKQLSASQRLTTQASFIVCSDITPLTVERIVVKVVEVDLLVSQAGNAFLGGDLADLLESKAVSRLSLFQ